MVRVAVFLRLGAGILGALSRGSRGGTDGSISTADFRALFGVPQDVCVDLYDDIEDDSIRPKHLLWGLMMMKLNTNQTALKALAGVRTRKTFRKWAWKAVEAISESFSDYIDWENRFDGDRGKTCLATLDGTDFRIPEPGNPHGYIWYNRRGRQVTCNPKWHSHKFKGPGVRHEVAVNIQTGDICWVHGPFPCGRWPDKKIFKHKLQGMLEDWEMVETDGHYRHIDGCRSKFEYNNEIDQRAKATARARHEAINRRFKEFAILGNRFKYDLSLHKTVVRAVAVCVQLTTLHNGPPFEVSY